MGSKGSGYQGYGGYGQTSGYYSNAGSSQGQIAPNQMSDDEALARRLQEQFNLESQETTHSDALGQQLPRGGSSGSASAYDTAMSSGQPSGPGLDFDERLDPASAAAPAYTTDYEMDLPSLRAFAAQVSQVGCTGCTKPLLHSKITPQDITKSWFEKKSISSNSAVKCSKCSIYTCVGCGTVPQDAPANQVSSGDWSLSWCCDQGRLFMIWVLLCLFDQNHIKATASLKGKATLGSFKVARPSYSSSSKAGTGFSGALSGLGFSRYTGSDSGLKLKASWDADDKIAGQVANFLEMIWPGSPESSTGSFDTKPPSVLLTMVSNSFMLDKIASLLRNDSIEDVSKRADLYDKVLSWIGAVGSHPFTANVVVKDRITRTDTSGLLQISFDESLSTAKGKYKDERSPSIAKCLENLSTQSRMIVENLEKSKAKQSVGTENILKICKGVILVGGLLNKYMPVQEVKPKDPVSAWEHWQREKAVGDVADQVMMSQSVWSKQARQLSHSLKDRIPRIVRELANCKTSLPPGIFVAHATTRVDVWKVLLIGPSNTPYENGLFEFDVFFPGNYPQQPPLFYFVAAARYRIGINPNLHPDGKVCLSLLNTWPGPNWNPNHSTPLQILVSIQAMIFCDEPWYNEPGREAPHVTQNPRAVSAAQEYNNLVQARVVQYCMLPWFKDQGIWGEIVAKHFRTNRQRILASTQRWAREEAQWNGPEMAGFGLGMGPAGPMGFGSMGMEMMGVGMGTAWDRVRGLKETAKELQQLLSMI